MNSFQILDENNNPIALNTLDEQVCMLTGNEVDPKKYCALGKREDFKTDREFVFNTFNWFDTVGWQIAAGKSFQDILDYYADAMKEFIGELDEFDNVLTLETIYPYHTKVLNYWMTAGYTAKQIVE